MGKYLKEFSKGIVKENPVFRLCLGTCPTLAISTTLSGSIGMGLAATLVLICSNTVISLLRKVIPDKIRIPAYITVIAGFVTIVQMLVQAFMPALNATLGIYLPLIVVNCIILGRAEAFAGKNPVLLSALDGHRIYNFNIHNGLYKRASRQRNRPRTHRRQPSHACLCYGSRRIFRFRYDGRPCQRDFQKARQKAH